MHPNLPELTVAGAQAMITPCACGRESKIVRYPYKGRPAYWIVCPTQEAIFARHAFLHPIALSRAAAASRSGEHSIQFVLGIATD